MTFGHLGTGTGMGRVSPFPNFGNENENDKLHSQLLGTGTGMKKSFPIFGNGNGRPGIPGNGREREFLLTPD